MSNAHKKAEEWIKSKRLIYSDALIESLAILIKEQDRDTRHACAEAVMSCSEDASGECIWKVEAHDACINASAV